MNAVNSSGDKVSKAYFHIVRIGLSVVIIGCEGVREEMMDVIFFTEVECGMRVGG